MTTNPRTSMLAALSVGSFMVIEGLWGFFSPMVFGVLTINHTRAAIHLVLGLGALTASSRHAPGYLALLGTIITTVALLWGIAGTHDFIVRVLAVNQPGAVLDGVVGPFYLLASFAGRRLAGHDDSFHPPGTLAH